MSLADAPDAGQALGEQQVGLDVVRLLDRRVGPVGERLDRDVPPARAVVQLAGQGPRGAPALLAIRLLDADQQVERLLLVPQGGVGPRRPQPVAELLAQARLDPVLAPLRAASAASSSRPSSW